VSTSRAHLTPRSLVVALSVTVALVVAFALAVLAGPALASTSCGSVNGIKISAKGVSCSAARSVYETNAGGHKPHGWVCSSALRECGKGRIGSKETVTWSYGDGGQGQGQGQGQDQ